MSQTSFDFASGNGLFKKIYADNMKDLLPDGVKLVKEVEFVPQAERHGASYNQALCLGMEHGFTYGGSQGQAFSLNGAIAGNVLQAEVRGHEMVLESVISTAAITRSENKEGAFVQATKHVVKNMFFSMNKRLETQCFYGQSGLAVIDSADPVTASVVITAAEWAPGIWSGANKMKVEIRTANGATSRGVAQIKRVDLSTRTITFDALPMGTVATDVLWYEGSYSKEFAGLKRIITNTGMLHGIDAAEHDLWSGNTYPVNGRLTLDAVERAVTLAVEKGLEEGDIALFCSTAAWNDLLEEQTARRRFDQSYDSKKGEAGHEELQFYTQAGPVKIIPSTHVKRGEAFVLSLDDLRRVGSQDVSFENPVRAGNYIYELHNVSGFGLRLYTDQALFCEAPGRQVLMTGITPGAQP